MLHKRKIVLAMSGMLLLMSQAVIAGESVKIKDVHGETMTFLLSSHPVVSFDSYHLILSTDETTVSYPLTDYVSFTLENTSTDVGKVKGSSPHFTFENGLTCQGLEPLSSLKIYTLEGVCIGDGKADSNGFIKLSLPQKRSSVYIVKTSKGSFKFTAK